jgi:hypothetical protein
MFRNILSFYGEEFLAPWPTPKLEDHSFSAACDCLFNISAATLHIGGRSSVRNLRARHVMMTETHVSWRHHSYANISRPTYFRHLTRFPGGLPSWKWLYGKTTLLQCSLLAAWPHRRSTIACQVVRSAVKWYCFMRDMLLPVASVKLAEGCLGVVLVASLVLFFLCQHSSSFWIVVFTVALVVGC